PASRDRRATRASRDRRATQEAPATPARPGRRATPAGRGGPRAPGGQEVRCDVRLARGGTLRGSTRATLSRNGRVAARGPLTSLRTTRPLTRGRYVLRATPLTLR